MGSKRVKLSVFAKDQGISYITAYRHWQQGNIEGVQLPSGSILVSDWKEGVDFAAETTNAIVYARVSDAGQKTRLKNQVTKLTEFAESKNYTVIETVEEVALGFSDHRTKLLSVLYRPDWDVLVVENRDAFMKFGFPYVEALLRKNQQEIIVLSDYDEESLPNRNPAMVQLSGEQNLIQLVQRTRAAMKNLIGMGSVKQNIENPIQGLID